MAVAGSLADTPSPDSVGLGTIDEGIELSSLLNAGELAGVALFGARPGPDQGPVPGRQGSPGPRRSGPASRPRATSRSCTVRAGL